MAYALSKSGNGIVTFKPQCYQEKVAIGWQRSQMKLKSQNQGIQD